MEKYRDELVRWADRVGFQIELDPSKPTKDFQRYRLIGHDSSLKIDLVRETPPFLGEPRVIKGMRFEDRRTLFAEKIGALGRMEPKDLVDAYFIFRRSGEDRASLVQDAIAKQGGFDALTIAQHLRQLRALLPRIPPFLERYMISPVTAEELHEFCDSEASAISELRL